MQVELHPDADRELIEHALFYERSEPGLGSCFLSEIESGIGLLLSQPDMGFSLDDELRAFFLNNFPFTLVYKAETERLWIVAVAHQRRRPDYWQERLARY